MKHFWINIDRCIDRREFMDHQFSKCGIDNVRISAATPEKIADYVFTRHPDSLNNDLEFACIVSHLDALQEGYNSGDDYFCVMEDDVNIVKLDFSKILGYLKETECKNNVTIDILQLYTNSHPFIIQMVNEHIMHPESDELKRWMIPRVDSYPSTAYYLISRDAAKRILDKFKVSDNTYDFSYSSWTAADNMIYAPVSTYMLTYPVVTTNIKYGSIIHPSHLVNHENANVIIKQIHRTLNLMHLFT